MTQDKVKSLTKYQEQLKSKLADKNVPEKQKNREQAYRAFLQNELDIVTKALSRS